MDYIPKASNYVINPDSDVMCDWVPFTTDMLKNIITGSTSDEQIEKMFPAQTFFGLFCGESSVDDIRNAIDVLKAALTIHNILLRKPYTITTDPETLGKKNDFLSLEKKLAPLINDLFVELRNYINFQLNECKPKDSLSQHLYTLYIPLSKSYYEWLKPRVEAYKAIGKITNTTPYLFFNMLYNISFSNAKTNPQLKIKIYGHLSLHFEWESLIDVIDQCRTDSFFAIEKYIGLMFLADTLSSIHLMTANVEIQASQMQRPTSGDLLTDFWFNCYDDSSDADLRIDNCEVCNGLFITNSKTQRGHERCMNRKRVMEARARKFLFLRKDGKTEEEAAKLASINPKTAEITMRSIIKEKQRKK